LEAGDSSGCYGREGILDYLKYGYVPSDLHAHAVCRTNDYAYDDFALAQMAKLLGKDSDYQQFGRRAFSFCHVFDPLTGFMRGRKSDGGWREPFDEFEWGGDYVEGSAWQHVFAVPHDPAQLIRLFGGPEKLVQKLDQMMTMEPYYDIGDYWTEIHEMTEMAAQKFGQYAHSNQPVHHVLYLYPCAGQPWKSEYWVRRVLNELYGPDPDSLSGDEDNGEMSSWFLLSSMGFFPLCPGHPSFVFGSPLFSKVTIHLEGIHQQSKLVIEAENNDIPDNCYVQSIDLNGKDLTSRTFVMHNELANGAHLKFVMGNTPNKQRVFQKEGLPFSFSEEFQKF